VQGLPRSCGEARIHGAYPSEGERGHAVATAWDPERHPARRWVVEVCHSWFNRFRRVLIRWEKRASLYLGFVQLAASLIIYRKLRKLHGLSE
jgi:hypothetical protein